MTISGADIDAVEAMDRAVEEILAEARKKMRRAGADESRIVCAMLEDIVRSMVRRCPRCQIVKRISSLVEGELENWPNAGTLGTH